VKTKVAIFSRKQAMGNQQTDFFRKMFSRYFFSNL